MCVATARRFFQAVGSKRVSSRQDDGGLHRGCPWRMIIWSPYRFSSCCAMALVALGAGGSLAKQCIRAFA